MEQATVGSRTPQELSTHSKTMADLLPLAAEKHAASVAGKYKQGDEWVEFTFAELGETSKSIAKALIAAGIGKGDKVSILANTRPEWTFAHFAIFMSGATVVPIYQTNSPAECKYVLEHSDAKLVFVEDGEQLAKTEQIRGELSQLQQVVVFEAGDAAGDALSLEAFSQSGSDITDEQLAERYNSVESSDISTIVYTSGTTGPPKGCLISHSNYRSQVDMAVNGGVGGSEGATVYLFLPLAHVFAMLIEFLAVDCGGNIAYWERDAQKIIPNLMEVKPQLFPSVPRIFEKVYTLANAAAAQKTPEEQELFHKAIEVGFKVRQMREQGQEVPAELQAAFDRGEEKVFQNVRALFGGELEFAITGAAPISEDILKFFYACGILVLEGYGMTETSTSVTVNRPDRLRFGSIGIPYDGVEIKFGEDGEILLKGPNIFQGYYKNEEATNETLVDGWLHTGDLGRMDDDGFVYITGRKKDIIITAGGKNITPANWENHMKQNRWISQAVMYGDRRPFLVGLVTLDPEEAPALAAELGIEADLASMAKDAKVRELVQKEIDELNEHFARVEQVKKFEILDHDLSQETGELTPTLKVKRNVVNEKYADIFESMYAS